MRKLEDLAAGQSSEEISREDLANLYFYVLSLEDKVLDLERNNYYVPSPDQYFPEMTF